MNRLYLDCYKIKGGFVGAPRLCQILAENGMLSGTMMNSLNHYAFGAVCEYIF